MYFFRLTSAVCLGAVLLWPFHSCTCPLHLWDHQESTRRCSTFGPEIHLNWVGIWIWICFRVELCVRHSSCLGFLCAVFIDVRKQLSDAENDEKSADSREERIGFFLVDVEPECLCHLDCSARHSRPDCGRMLVRLNQSFLLLFCYSALRDLLLFETHLHKKKEDSAFFQRGKKKDALLTYMYIYIYIYISKRRSI